MKRNTVCSLLLLAWMAPVAHAGWRVLEPFDNRQPLPDEFRQQGEPIEVGAPWPNDHRFRWLVGELEIPETIDGRSTTNQVVGLQINCGDGGEVYVNRELQSRFDNDHPALALISEQAVPGAKVELAVQVYGKVQGGDSFGEAKWVIVEPERGRRPLQVRVRANRETGPVPDGIAGLSQGGGLSDYEDATAAKLREGGFKWFRMDNIFTPVVQEKDGELVYNWEDYLRRLDFIANKMKADPIFAVSYMPIPFDAVENHDRQSAPKDYGLWEDLCYRAAKLAVDRGTPVPYWEVWNEVNTGWLKPGPEDKGTERYHKLYNEALGRLQPEMEVIRRFEAYCKLYEATVRGVRRADPDAKFGGPALASGPFEHDQRNHCFHGKGFARGLMMFCQQEKLPLDFVSWHEYFQEAGVIVDEVKAFREYMSDLPEIRDSVKSYMITEWNQAWWADRPHDHEIGAAWCADSLTNACIPHSIDRPCLFYVKQGDRNFRGDFSILMEGNTPKATFNVLRIFNHLSGNWVKVDGTDADVSAVAAYDEEKQKLSVVVVNFRYRYGMPRKVALQVDDLPKSLKDGQWCEWVVDATRSNAWHNWDKAELEQTDSGRLKEARLEWQRTLLPNSVTLIEITPAKERNR